MKAYFDTSTFALLAFADQGYEQLDGWIATRSPETCFSDFGWGEFVSAVGRRVRANDLANTIGEILLLEAKAYLQTWSSIALASNIIDDAADMLMDFSLNLRLPDAIHIAISRRTDAVLVTTDRNQIRAARKLGCAAVNPLFDEITS